MDYTVEFSESEDETTWTEYSSTAPDWLTFSATQSTENSLVSFQFTTVVGEYSPEGLILRNNTPVTDYDLSLVDCAGNSCARTTANCYMVHAPGTYKIPLVYGNSIKNGETNEAAYKSTVTGANVLTTFVNHLDQEIVDPWIKNNGITIGSAKLIWQDAKNLISNIGIEGDYLTFEITKENITQGCAYLSAVDSDGKVAWSWLIWITKETLEDCIPLTNGSYTYNVAPLNLGWSSYRMRFPDKSAKVVISSQSGVNILCEYTNGTKLDNLVPALYYQWGSPKPTPYRNTTWFDENMESHHGFEGKNNSITIGESIQNPLIFSNQNTYNTYYYNCWDINKTDSNISLEPTNKTIYDPCPPGFCVPSSGCLQTIQNAASNGLVFSDPLKFSLKGIENHIILARIGEGEPYLYIPTLGAYDMYYMRIQYDFTFSSQSAYLLSSHKYSIPNYRELDIVNHSSTGNVYCRLDSWNEKYGCSIRPVRE